MSNRDFDDIIKERLFDHFEPIDPNSWETILAKQRAKKRRVVAWRSFSYSFVAAAAVIIFLLLLNPPTIPPLPQTPTIAVIDPDQFIYRSDSTSVATKELPLREEVIEKKEVKLVTNDIVHNPQEIVSEPPEEEVTNLFAQEVEVFVATSSADTINIFSDPLSLQQNSYYSTLYAQKHSSASDKWTIALASVYSSAAGESPFTLTRQTLQGQTRIADIYSSSFEPDQTEDTDLLFSPPLSLGINFQKEITSWLSLGMGVNYTLLQSKFSSSYNHFGAKYSVRQSLHYVGLPVTALVNIVRQPKLRVYASAGGMVEKAVTSHYSTSSKFSNKSENEYVTGLQWSVFTGLGVEVPLSQLFGIYLEPGIGYYFDNNQPRSIRTIQPAQFKAEFGLRVRI
jgi:hypothetical protein